MQALPVIRQRRPSSATALAPLALIKWSAALRQAGPRWAHGISSRRPGRPNPTLRQARTASAATRSRRQRRCWTWIFNMYMPRQPTSSAMTGSPTLTLHGIGRSQPTIFGGKARGIDSDPNAAEPENNGLAGTQNMGGDVATQPGSNNLFDLPNSSSPGSVPSPYPAKCAADKAHTPVLRTGVCLSRLAQRLSKQASQDNSAPQRWERR